jgi:DNA-directed RNA polymerase specialized sigma24 family protein
VITLMGMGASRADAEDAAQEAMFLAWRQWESVREPAALVRIIAVRCFLKQIRKKGEYEVALDKTVEPTIHSDLEIFGEEQRRVLRLLRGLSEGQRTVAALFYDGLSCEETELTGNHQLRSARNCVAPVTL